MNPSSLNTPQKFTYAAFRIVTGFLFFQHGAQKILGWFGGFGDGGTAPLASMMGVAGILELAGGLLVSVGLYTRFVAFVLSGEMAVAYFMAHVPRGLWPIQNGGEKAAFYCFAFLLMVALGSGAFSLDRKLRA